MWVVLILLHFAGIEIFLLVIYSTAAKIREQNQVFRYLCCAAAWRGPCIWTLEYKNCHSRQEKQWGYSIHSVILWTSFFCSVHLTLLPLLESIVPSWSWSSWGVVIQLLHLRHYMIIYSLMKGMAHADASICCTWDYQIKKTSFCIGPLWIYFWSQRIEDLQELGWAYHRMYKQRRG
jgi:hypothetical protein